MSAQNSKRTAGRRKGKPRGRPFAKGDERINAGGRPKLPAEVKAELEEMRGPLTLKAIRTLERNMDSPDGMVSNVAAREWLRKTLPDEALKLEVSGPEGGPVETKAVLFDDSPGALADVIGVLRSAGLLEAGRAEGAQSETDAVHQADPD